jgi:hypothetical protein
MLYNRYIIIQFLKKLNNFKYIFNNKEMATYHMFADAHPNKYVIWKKGPNGVDDVYWGIKLKMTYCDVAEHDSRIIGGFLPPSVESVMATDKKKQAKEKTYYHKGDHLSEPNLRTYKKKISQKSMRNKKGKPHREPEDLKYGGRYQEYICGISETDFRDYPNESNNIMFSEFDNCQCDQCIGNYDYNQYSNLLFSQSLSDEIHEYDNEIREQEMNDDDRDEYYREMYEEIRENELNNNYMEGRSYDNDEDYISRILYDSEVVSEY